MITCTTIAQLRATLAPWRGAGERIAFVPTMGNLHEGHLSLVRAARARAPRVVVSIFVNPLQFGPNEDFQRYPRTEAQDAALLQGAGADVLFLPSVAEMYPRPLAETTFVEVPGLSEILCGAFRPGHFRGVATIVARLLNIVQPDIALFGEKDFQQLAIIQRMVEDLAFPVVIVGMPTLRGPDGLAMSSRNGYLSPRERAQAAAIHQTLQALAGRLRAGERDCAALEAQGAEALKNQGFRPDYIAIRRARDLTQVPQAVGDEAVILIAAWLGKTRLIDNLRVAVV